MPPAKPVCNIVESLVGGRLNDFYSSMFLPNYMRNMLLLHGISELEHLLDFDEGAVAALAEDIRDGKLTGTFVDMSSRQEQIRYFGAVVVNFSGFNFRSRELKLLNKLGTSAAAFIEEEAKQEEERAIKQHKKKRSRAHQLSYNTSNESLGTRDSSLRGGESSRSLR